MTVIAPDAADRSDNGLEIGGFQRISLIDYPGKIASLVFLAGCNMRCPFCHNADLVLRNYPNLRTYDRKDILEKLRESAGFVDAVQISGGEPTLWSGLVPFMEECRRIGFLIKLDTNGTNPRMVEEVISRGLVDYIAMDIKATMAAGNKYGLASGTAGDVVLKNVRKTIGVIMGSGIEYEFRTTAVPGIVSLEDLVGIAGEIRSAKAYYIQQFRPGSTLDPRLGNIKEYEMEDLLKARDRILEMGLVGRCEVRA